MVGGEIGPGVSIEVALGRDARKRGDPAWWTVNVRTRPSPETVIVPVRTTPSLEATLNATVPLPRPVEPSAMAIQSDWATAVQPTLALTASASPIAPAAGQSASAGSRVQAGTNRWVRMRMPGSPSNTLDRTVQGEAPPA